MAPSAPGSAKPGNPEKTGETSRHARNRRALYVSTFFLRFAFAAIILVLPWYLPSNTSSSAPVNAPSWSGMDLFPAGLDLSGAVSNITISNESLAGTSLPGKVFVNVTFMNCTLVNAALVDCDVSMSEMDRCMAANSTMNMTEFNSSLIVDSTADNCTAYLTTFRNCTLSNILDPSPTSGNDWNLLFKMALIAIPYPIMEMLTANMFGLLSDRIGRRGIIIFGLFTAGACSVLYTFSTSTPWLVLVHAMHGVGAAATIAPATAYLSDNSESGKVGFSMGVYDMFTLLGYIAGPVIGGAFLGLLITFNLPIYMSFFFISALLGISAVVLAAFATEMEHHRDTPKELVMDIARFEVQQVRIMRSVFRTDEIKVIFPIWLCVTTLLELGITYLPPVMKGWGTSSFMTGLIFAAAGGIFLVGQPFWGRLSDRFGRFPIMVYGIFSLVGLVFMLMVLSGVLFGTVTGAAKIVGIGFLGLFGAGSASFVPAALALMADKAPSGGMGASMGLYSFAMGFGGFLADAVAAIIIYNAKSRSVLGLLVFAAVLIGFAAVWMAYHHSKMASRSDGKTGAEQKSNR